MAKRRVEVELLLVARNYIGEASEATVTTKVLSREVHELGDEADATGRDLDQMAGSAAIAKHEVQGLGRAAAVAGLETRNLDVEIVKARDRLLSLQQAFARNPNNRGLLGDIGGAKRDLRELENISRAIRTDLDETAGDIFRNLSGLGRGLRGALIPTVIGLAAVLSPLIGAAVSGIVGGSFVGAGMAGGIFSAWRQPLVKSQWETFKNEMGDAFFGGKSSKAFVEPVRDSLLLLEKDFKDLHIDDAFVKAAPSVTILAQGIGDLVKNLMPGWNRLLDQSGAFTTVFAHGLGQTGKALSDFMTDLADSPGTIEGLELSFRLLNGTIVITGNTLNFLADQFSNLADFNDWLFHVTDGFLSWIPGIDAVGRNLDALSGKGEGVKNTLEEFDPVAAKAAGAVGGLADATVQAEHATDRYRTALQDLNFEVNQTINMHLDLARARLRENQALADFTKSLHDNGTTFDENTEAGRRNAAAWISVLDAALAVRKAEMDNGKSADEATREYDKQVQKLLDAAAAAGVAKTELDKLAGLYLIEIHPVITGSAQDWAMLRDAERQSVLKIPVTTTKKHAAGGWDAGDSPFWAGEQGRELIFPNGAPSYVMNHRDSMAWAAVAGGGGTVRHEHYLNLSVNGGQTRRILIDDGKARGKSDAQMAAAYP